MDYNNCKSRFMFNKGRVDRRNKKGCLSANGSYLNGWYFQYEQEKEENTK